MTIATEKLKQSIRRDTLVKLTVMMDATDHLTLVSGNNYKVSIPIGATYEPVAAYQNNASITMSWNSSTNELTITKTHTIGDDYPVTVKFYVYLTTGQTKYLDKDDPTGAISNVVEWLPKLDANIPQKEYVRDIFTGGFPVATGSNIDLINDNSYFDGFFERYEDYICPFYFYNNEVKIWIGINESYQYIGNYIIESISLKNNNLIKFNLKPEIKKLMTSATWGNKDRFIYATKDLWTDLKPDYVGLPVPLIFSPCLTPTIDADPDYGYPRCVVDSSKEDLINKAYCIDYDESISSSKNLTYVCGRAHKILGSQNKSIGVSNGTTGNTVTTTGATGSLTWRKATITSSSHYFSVVSNMQIDVNWSSSGWQTGTLAFVDHDTHEIWIFNSYPAESFTDIKRRWPVNIWYRDPDDDTGLLTTFDYNHISTISQTSGPNGDYLIIVYMDSAYYTSFKPNYEYYYTFFTDDVSLSPKELAYKFLDAVSLPHNHSDTSTKSNPAFFQIPRIGETEYQNYADYLPDIIRPMTMSMLRLDYSTGYYEFIEMPSTIDSSNYPSTYHDITDTDIIKGTLQYSKKYSDIVTKLVVSNKDIYNKKTHLLSSKTYNNIRESENYGIDRVHEINHAGLYTDVAPYDLTTVNDILKTPTVTYTLSVSLKFFDIKVLDVIKVTSKEVMNNINDGTEFVFLVVTSVEKGGSSIKIEAQQVTYL